MLERPIRHTLALLLLALAHTTSAGAAIITVDSTADAAVQDGNCTLRDAVRSANYDAAVDGCVQGSGADTIVLGAGTYTLALAGNDANAVAGDLDVVDPVTIQGAGAATTIIDGGGLDRVFEVATSGTVAFVGLTIRNGDVATQPNPVGGGIEIAGGTVTVDGCVIEGNAAFYGGGINVTEGTVTVTGSVITGNEGGIGAGLLARDGPVAIVESTIDGNTAAQFGGGIATNGDESFTVSISGSTIVGNTAVTNGGGGVANTNNCTMTIRNSTISGNMAPSGLGAGVYQNFGDPLTLANVTVAFNEGAQGGGVYNNAGTVTLRNTIVADNAGTDGNPDCGGTLGSEGHNLVADLTDCAGFVALGSDVTGIDAALLPLAGAGGATEVHGLAPDSPARNAGDPAVPGSGGTACEALDQRGVARPQDAACDIGAVEADPVPATTTTTVPGAGTTTTTTTTTVPGASTSTTTTPSSTTTTTTLVAAVCSGGALMRDAHVKIARWADPAGDERITLRGTIDLPGGVPAVLAPAQDGLRLVLVDRGAGDAVLLDLAVPAGERGTSCDAKDGWKRLAYRNRSTALDPPACTAGSAAGLRAVRLRDRRAKGKGVAFKATVRPATVAPPIGPLALTVVLAPGAGACGTADFTPAQCAVRGKTWVCR